MGDDVINLIDIRFHHMKDKLISLKNVPAVSLISRSRLDIPVKLDYISALASGKNAEYEKEQYRKNLEIISNGSFIEPGSSNKKCFDDYDRYLQKLIQMMRNGFDQKISLIPVSKNGIPLDGAHRIAVAAYFDLPVTVAVFDVEDFQYDFDYFKSRFCSAEYLDSLALTYLKYTQNKTSLLIEWPRKGRLGDLVHEVFGSDIIYCKEETLNYNAVKNIMLMNYWGEDWIGASGAPKLGIRSKALACFEGGSTKFHWVENLEIEDVHNRKARIRSFVQGEKHVIHSTETFYETRMVSQSILNRNSIYMLGQITPEYEMENILSDLDDYESEKENFAIGGSCLLSLMNLRRHNDIDILTDRESISNKYNNHNEYFELYGHTNLSFHHNPENIFYYFGYKFCMPEAILRMKRTRNETKDRSDIMLLENSLTKKSKNSYFQLKLIWYGLLRRLILLIIRLLTLLKVKGLAKVVYNFLRRKNK